MHVLHQIWADQIVAFKYIMYISERFNFIGSWKIIIFLTVNKDLTVFNVSNRLCFLAVLL